MSDTYSPKATFDIPGGSAGAREIRQRAVEVVREVDWVSVDLDRSLSVDLSRSSMTVSFRREDSETQNCRRPDRRSTVTLDEGDFDRERITDAARGAIEDAYPDVDGAAFEVWFIDAGGVRCEIECVAAGDGQ